VKRFTVVLRHSPFQTMRNFEALRMTVGLVMSDNEKTLVLVEDAVYLLSAKAHPEAVHRFDPAKHLEFLSDMEFPTWVEKESLEERGIRDLRFQAEVKSRAEIAALLAESDAVVTY